MNELVKKIRSRGYWEVVIRPHMFVGKRLPVITGLYRLVERTSVNLRGWDFPHIDPHTEPHIDVDWIGQESQWENYLEVWRFYQSGQFFDILGMDEDWHDQSSLWPPSGDWRPGATFSVTDAVFRFTEIFEFGTRLQLAGAGDESVHIEVTAGGLKGRELVFDVPGRVGLFRKRKASLDKLPYQVNLPQAELIANPRELALKPAIELFQRFDWDPSIDLLREIQSKLLQRVQQSP